MFKRRIDRRVMGFILACTVTGTCTVPLRECQNSQMLTDPEESSQSYYQEIWAYDFSQAQSQCRRMVQRFGGTNPRVTGGTGKANSLGKRKHICWWDGEADVRYGDRHERN